MCRCLFRFTEQFLDVLASLRSACHSIASCDLESLQVSFYSSDAICYCARHLVTKYIDLYRLLTRFWSLRQFCQPSGSVVFWLAPHPRRRTSGAVRHFATAPSPVPPMGTPWPGAALQEVCMSLEGLAAAAGLQSASPIRMLIWGQVELLCH